MDDKTKKRFMLFGVFALLGVILLWLLSRGGGAAGRTIINQMAGGIGDFGDINFGDLGRGGIYNLPGIPGYNSAGIAGRGSGGSYQPCGLCAGVVTAVRVPASPPSPPPVGVLPPLADIQTSIPPQSRHFTVRWV